MADSAKTSLVAKTQPDVVIFEGNYPAWPWVLKTSSGDLVCMFREDKRKTCEGSAHGFSPMGRQLITRSTDNGRTWSPTTMLRDVPDVDDCGSGVIELPDGTLLAACYSRLMRSGGPSQTWVTRSKDGGQTWTPAIILTDEDTRLRAAPVLMSNGDILVPIYRSMFSDKGHVCMTSISSDGGKTWDIGYVPNAPGDELNEWGAMEVEPGRIIGLHRDEAEATRGSYWITESHDFGRSWTDPAKSNVRCGFAAASPHLGRHGNKVVLTYAEDRMVSVAMVTTDDPDYLQWDVENRVRCFQYRADGKRIADASYPCSVDTGPHERLVVDYEIESLITPDPKTIVIDYDLKAERKQITGHFVETPVDWGTAD